MENESLASEGKKNQSYIFKHFSPDVIGQSVEEAAFDFESIGSLSLTDVSCVDEWITGSAINVGAFFFWLKTFLNIFLTQTPFYIQK